MCGFAPGLLNVLLSLVAQLDLQLLGLHLQVFLPVGQGFAGLRERDEELEKSSSLNPPELPLTRHTTPPPC